MKQDEEIAESFEPHLKSSAPMLLDDCERLQMMGILHARKPSTSVSHRAVIRDHAELSGLRRHHRAVGFLDGVSFAATISRRRLFDSCRIRTKLIGSCQCSSRRPQMYVSGVRCGVAVLTSKKCRKTFLNVKLCF